MILLPPFKIKMLQDSKAESPLKRTPKKTRQKKNLHYIAQWM